jgi:hypothetical protein
VASGNGQNFQCEVYVNVHYFTYESSFAAPFVEKTLLSTLSCLCTFVKNQLTIYAWVLLFPIGLSEWLILGSLFFLVVI